MTIPPVSPNPLMKVGANRDADDALRRRTAAEVAAGHLRLEPDGDGLVRIRYLAHSVTVRTQDVSSTLATLLAPADAPAAHAPKVAPAPAADSRFARVMQTMARDHAAGPPRADVVHPDAAVRARIADEVAAGRLRLESETPGVTVVYRGQGFQLVPNADLPRVLEAHLAQQDRLRSASQALDAIWPAPPGALSTEAAARRRTLQDMADGLLALESVADGTVLVRQGDRQAYVRRELVPRAMAAWYARVSDTAPAQRTPAVPSADVVRPELPVAVPPSADMPGGSEALRARVQAEVAGGRLHLEALSHDMYVVHRPGPQFQIVAAGKLIDTLQRMFDRMDREHEASAAVARVWPATAPAMSEEADARRRMIRELGRETLRLETYDTGLVRVWVGDRDTLVPVGDLPRVMIALFARLDQTATADRAKDATAASVHEGPARARVMEAIRAGDVRVTSMGDGRVQVHHQGITQVMESPNAPRSMERVIALMAVGSPPVVPSAVRVGVAATAGVTPASAAGNVPVSPPTISAMHL